MLSLSVFRNERNCFSSYFNIPGLKGMYWKLMVQGMHSEDWFIAYWLKAINNGLHIINVTQCSGGSVNMGKYETGRYESNSDF
jgi:L-asparaginase